MVYYAHVNIYQAAPVGHQHLKIVLDQYSVKHCVHDTQAAVSKHPPGVGVSICQRQVRLAPF
jgi:hypothetical protein